jgi:hypothetical protein
MGIRGGMGCVCQLGRVSEDIAVVSLLSYAGSSIIRIELADHRDSTNMILEIARADTATYMKLRLPSFTWDPATAHFEPV